MSTFIVDRANRDEALFLLKLIENTKLKIKKTENKFCNVDFELSRDGGTIGYVELKTRYYNLSAYSDLFIGYVKLHAINVNYPNTYLVWDDKFSGIVYWCKFEKSLLNCRTGYNGSEIFYIPKRILSTGIEKLYVELSEIVSIAV